MVLVINSSQANEVIIELPKWKLTSIENTPSLRASAVYKGYLWVAGDNNTVYLSENSGMSWDKKSIPSPLKYDFRDICRFRAKPATTPNLNCYYSKLKRRTFHLKAAN